MRSFYLALAASLAAHVALLAISFQPLLPPPAPALAVRLTPAAEKPLPDVADALVKNTLAARQDRPRQTPGKAAAPAKKAPDTPQSALDFAETRLAEHLFYPEEAIARQLEGEARLIIVLAEGGEISAVSLAASSGHAILDRAAVRAAWAIGRIGGGNAGEIILPVVFRLR